MILENIKSVKDLPVYTFKINNEVLPLLNECNWFVKEIPEKIKCNLTGWRSHWNTHEHSDYLNDFSINLSKELETYIGKTEILNSWFAVYEFGDMAIEHEHGENTWACVVYLDVGEKQSPLVVEQQGFKFKIGNIFVFPGNLTHFVPRTIERRIILAINFKQL